MILRLLEIYLPDDEIDALDAVLEEKGFEERWRETLQEGVCRVKLVVKAAEAEPLLDALESRFKGGDHYRVVVLPIEATLPRIEEEKEKKNEEEREAATEEQKKNGEEQEQKHKPKLRMARISREELYADIAGAAELTPIYIALVIVSSVVAAVGLIRDNVAVIIGAMVIAPLLGPNVAQALGTTLGDLKLIARALRTNLVGLAVSVFLSIAVGMVVTLDGTEPQLASRSVVSLSDVVLALAAGMAGVFAFTAGLSASIVGVMVAVALLPVIVALGLFIGAGLYHHAVGALLLLAINLVCINLAGVGTLLLQNVRPRTWYETDKAGKYTRIAMAWWAALLALLILLMYLRPNP